MTIEEINQSDIAQLEELQPSDWSGVPERYEFYISAKFCFPIKVTMNNKIVGVGAYIMHDDVAWLAHIVTHNDFRNRGIGKLITQTLIHNARDKKCDTIYLCATELGQIVYQKLGFEIETEYIFFKNIKKTDCPISNNIIPITKDMIKSVLAIDKKCTGEDRTNSIRDHLMHGYVYKTESAIEGYYLPTLGHGPIIANTSSAGLELMKYRLKIRGYATFPIDNLVAKAFMAEHHLKSYNKQKRMRLGPERKTSLSNIYNRVGGKLG